MPMPDNRVRFDFQFASPIKQLPASFITQKPIRLVLDFIEAESKLPPALASKAIDIGSLTGYKVVAINNRIRAIFDLTQGVSIQDKFLIVFTVLLFLAREKNSFRKEKKFILPIGRLMRGTQLIVLIFVEQRKTVDKLL